MAVGRLIRRSHGVDLDAVAHFSRTHVDTARLWASIQVYRHAAVTGTADLNAIAEERRVPRQILEPVFERLVATGYAQRVGDLFALTPKGAAEVSAARDVISSWITETLAESEEFQGRPDRLQVQGAMERIARGVLLDREPVTDVSRPAKLGPPQAPRPEPATMRLRALSVPGSGPALVSGEAPTRPFRRGDAPRRPPGPPPPRRR
jgi:hypothetical protein